MKTETGGAPDAQTCGAAKPTPAASPVDGTWEKTLTAKESLEGCPTDDPIKDRQSIRMVLSRGTAQILVSIDGSPFTVGYDGTYQVFRDRMTLQDPAATFSVTWRREGSTLTLADMQGGECGDVIVWTLHPWKRVG